MRLLAGTALLGMLLALSAGGCKTRVIDIPVTGAGADQVFSKMIGSQGGTLRVDDPGSPAFGAEISVPAGAVDTDTELSISPAAAPPAGPLGLRPTGATLLVRFTRVSRAVTVRLPFLLDLDGSEAPVISRYGENEKAWSSSLARPLDDESRRFELATEEFGWFFTGGQSVGGGGPADGGQLLDAPTSVEVLPADGVPPTFAGLASAEVVGQGRARLTWSEASDDRTAAEKIRYRLYLPSFAVLGEPQGETPPGALSLTVPVQPGIPYYFLVRAVDEAGNEDSNLEVITVRVPLVFDGGPAGDVGPDVPVDAPVDASTDASGDALVDAAADAADGCTAGCTQLIDDFEGDTSDWSLTNSTIEQDPTTSSTALHLQNLDTGAGCAAGFGSRFVSIPSGAMAFTFTVSGNVPPSGDPHGQAWLTLGGLLAEIPLPLGALRTDRYCVPAAQAGTTSELVMVVRSTGTCTIGTAYEAWIDDLTFTTDATGCINPQ